jgi:gliding motility-associated-like protein
MLKMLRFTHTLALLAFAGALNAQHPQHGDHDDERGGQRQYEFIPNKGQENSTVKYSALINGGQLFFTNNRLVYNLVDNSEVLNLHHGGQPTPGKKRIRTHAYYMTWINGNTESFIGSAKTKHYYNYFRGRDKLKWASKVYAFNKLQLKNLYPGISVEFETNENENFEYTYRISPGASPNQIIQKYEGALIKIGRNGDLLVETTIKTVKELKPVAWQIINGVRKEIPCNYKLSNSTVYYDFPKGYDQSCELVIDPVLIFGSYSGSTADNFGMTATYDDGAHLYTGGTCFNNGFPVTPGAYDTAYTTASEPQTVEDGHTDVVINRYEPLGTYMEYATYLGGEISSEIVTSLIVDKDNNLLLYGATGSADFPVTPTAYDTSFNGGDYLSFVYNGTRFRAGTDIYVAKLSNDGSSLLASTFIGGSKNDGVNINNDTSFITAIGTWEYKTDSIQFNYGDQYRGEIQTDKFGNFYFASSSRSADFPIVGGYDNTLGGRQDAVIVKMDPNLTSIIFSTFHGGSDKDAGYSLKLDPSGDVYFTGGTTSSDMPTSAGSLYPTYKGGIADGYVAKIKADGSTLLNSTYMGTTDYDQSFFVEIDKDGLIYLYGQTKGTTVFPIISATYSVANSGSFIVRLDSNLTSFSFSTLFGSGTGKVDISPSAFLVDVCGNIYISGWGGNIISGPPTSGMPVTPDAYIASYPTPPPTYPGTGYNFYIACFQRNMQSLLYGSYYGGKFSKEHVDGGTSRFDKYGVIYQSVCAGCGSFDDFPTTPTAWSTINKSSNCNNGVFKFDFEISPVADFVTDQFEGCNPLTINFTNSSPPDLDWLWDFGNGDTSSVIYSPTITYTNVGSYTVTLITEDSICGLIDTALKVITVHPATGVTASSDTALCAGAPLTFSATSVGATNGFVWSSSPTWADTLNSPLTDSLLHVNVNSDTSFYVQTFNPWCNDVDTITVDIQDLDPTITTAIVSCAGDSLILTVVNSTPETYTIDWSPNAEIISGDGTPSILINPTDTTMYSVLLTSSAGCTATTSVTIDPSTSGLSTVIATASPYDIVTGESSNLTAVPNLVGFTYSWSPPIGLDNPFSPTPVATPTATTVYTVTISQGGCSRIDTVIVRVHEFKCGDPYIYVPNAFTPNGSGHNDVLYVRGRNISTVYFAVFERWGEKVFETNDMNIGWDGKVNGRDADPAVFDYYLKVKCVDGQEYFQKGNVTLIR